MILSATLNSIKMISLIDQLAAKNKISYQVFSQGRLQNSSTNLQMSRSHLLSTFTEEILCRKLQHFQNFLD